MGIDPVVNGSRASKKSVTRFSDWEDVRIRDDGLLSAPAKTDKLDACYPELRSPAEMPLIEIIMARCALISVSPARQRRNISSCKWLSGAM